MFKKLHRNETQEKVISMAGYKGLAIETDGKFYASTSISELKF